MVFIVVEASHKVIATSQRGTVLLKDFDFLLGGGVAKGDLYDFSRG